MADAACFCLERNTLKLYNGLIREDEGIAYMSENSEKAREL